MHAFNAAIQIPTHLDDRAWEILKSRLEEQRDQAEHTQDEFNARYNLMVATSTANASLTAEDDDINGQAQQLYLSLIHI